MFVVCRMVEQAKAGAIPPRGCWLIRLVECAILACLHVSIASYNCNAHPWLHDVCRFGIGLSWFPWRGFLQGFVVLQYLGFISKHSITWNPKGREATALVQTGLDVFLLFFTLMAKGLKWRLDSIKIWNTHVQNAISLVFQDIPNL